MKKFKTIFCAIFRHSRIQKIWFGYYSCGRCDARLGDKLAGSYNDMDLVIINHCCKKCYENYKNTNWIDKFMTPYPFKNCGRGFGEEKQKKDRK